MKAPRLLRSQRPAGVSLVEVTFALGLLSFVVIPLIALLATGFSGYRAAIDKTVQAAIVQHIRASAAPIDAPDETIPDAYYQTDGVPTTSSDPQAVYRSHLLPATRGTLIGKNGPAALDRVFVCAFTIVHIPSGQTNASGAIHISPRE